MNVLCIGIPLNTLTFLKKVIRNMDDYKTLMKFLEDNHNDIKNFDMSFSGKEIVDLIGLFAFTAEAAKFLAEQEAIKGTDRAEAKMRDYEDKANYFMTSIANLVRAMMTFKPKSEDEKH